MGFSKMHVFSTPRLELRGKPPKSGRFKGDGCELKKLMRDLVMPRFDAAKKLVGTCDNVRYSILVGEFWRSLMFRLILPLSLDELICCALIEVFTNGTLKATRL